MQFRLTFALTAVLSFLAAQTNAEILVEFDERWKEQGFLRLFSNEYLPRGRELDIVSDGTVSLFWRPVTKDAWGVGGADWTWRVTEGVAPTDLSQKGGDDRNVALYFVFAEEATAATLDAGSARRLLRNRNAKGLVYVWGGMQSRGDFLPSPYHPRLRTIVLRGSGTGLYQETVDLRRDFRKSFGTEPGVLVGLAVSADSDDTQGRIRASIADLTLH